MLRSHRLLALFLVLALGASTGCTAVGYSSGSANSGLGGERSSGPRDAPGSDEALQSSPAAQATDTTAAVTANADTSVTGPPTTDAADSKRRVDSKFVVLGVLAVVAGLIFLVAR